MPTNSILSKLDLVLYAISESKRDVFEFKDVENAVPNNENYIELYLILDKLVADGYIKTEEAKIDRPAKPERKGRTYTATVYSITFDGKIFCEQGGYSGLNMERNRLATLESRQRRLSVITFWLTLVIAVATSVAGIYYFLEIKRLIGNHQ